MIYVGSKNRFSKELIPIIQSYITNETKGYLEPFVGGANVIDKIKCHNKIGCDIHKELISLLKALRDGWIPPYEVSKKEYLDVKDNRTSYPDYLVGYIGFELSFGAKWFGGYVKRNDKKSHGDIYSFKHCLNQAPNLKGIKFIHTSFLDLPKDEIKGYVIYCDIPYKGTTKYATRNFPYDEFYKWANEMAEHNTVLISEYDMPSVFKCIWSKETKANFDSNRVSGDESNKRVEKLFLCNAESGYIKE